MAHCWPGTAQFARDRVSTLAVDRPAADRMAFARIANRAVRPECTAQDRQLLLHCPAPPTRNNLDPSAHTTAHMTARCSAFDLTIHRRSVSKRQSALHLPTPQRGFGTTLTKGRHLWFTMLRAVFLLWAIANTRTGSHPDGTC